jgi:uncharacterized membrane protein YedE/YeeE
MIRTGAAAAVAAVLLVGALRLDDGTTSGRAAAFLAVCGAGVGFVMQRSQFCFTAAFRDLFLVRGRRAALGLLAALAAGSAGYAVLFGAQLPDPSRYLPETAHIAPAGPVALLGGVSFGIGMVLAGGCISGHLFRLGEGSLQAPAALLGCIPGYWLAFSLWNVLYVKSVSTSPVVWLPAQLGYAGALGLQLAVLAGLAALLFRTCRDVPAAPREAADLRGALRRIFAEPWPAWAGGAAIGILGTFAYLWNHPLGVTGELGRISRRAGVALALTPSRLEGLDRLAGCRAIGSERAITESGIFAVALVAGSLLSALLAGEFRLRKPKPRSLALAAAGGVLLGFGAMISLGCTVGTLLSGIMAFSLHGWIFLAGLFGGSWAGTALLRRLA